MTVVVVGGGPSGLLAAWSASKRGVDVLVLEEHSRVGVPVHCAGLLSASGLRRIGVQPSPRFVQNRVRGAHFYSPSGLTFTVEKPETVAYVVDRAEFDSSLADKAVNSGVHIQFKAMARRIRRSGGRLTVSWAGGSLEAPLVVDAEGVRSRLVMQMGLKTIDWRRVLPAAQVELSGVDVDGEYVEVHLGRRVAPKFFAWVIPLDGSTARVGLACGGVSPVRMLKRFVRRRFGRGIPAKCGAGCVLTCGPIPRTYADNFLVVGDAAGQVKPTTGGGVITGGICALTAGEVAADAAMNGIYSSRLRRYEEAWRDKLGGEFRWMMRARRLLDGISDRLVDEVFKRVISLGLDEELSTIGDMDLQAASITQLTRRLALRAPTTLVKLLLRLIF